MARQLFTADEHLKHKNIIRHCKRPWTTIDKMSKDIIELQNDTCKTGDTLFHIGDWCWGSKANLRPYELMAEKLRDDVVHHLILGNHDALNPFKYVNIGFTSVHTSLQIVVGDHAAYLIHDPSAWTCLPPDSILICGHVHGFFKILKNAVNVGVDVWDYKPVTEEEILHGLNIKPLIEEIMCNKIEARIECEKCGYPYSEAKWPDNADQPLKCNSSTVVITDHIELCTHLKRSWGEHHWDCKCLYCR